VRPKSSWSTTTTTSRGRRTHDLGDGPEELVVVRKGATPAFPGQQGFVGGSMGDDAVIIQGTGPRETLPWEAEHGGFTDELQRAALYSTVHGAGRVMSRTEAAGKRHRAGKRAGQFILDAATGEPKNIGKVSQAMMNDWLGERGVILRGGGRDESPHAYRRLPEVLDATDGTIEVRHTLRPIIVVMAGEHEFDPYKD
jgi:tRNA-splicing ligase RtcB